MRYCGECKNFIYEAMVFGGPAVGHCSRNGIRTFNDDMACEEEQVKEAIRQIEVEGKYHG